MSINDFLRFGIRFYGRNMLPCNTLPMMFNSLGVNGAAFGGVAGGIANPQNPGVGRVIGGTVVGGPVGALTGFVAIEVFVMSEITIGTIYIGKPYIYNPNPVVNIGNVGLNHAQIEGTIVGGWTGAIFGGVAGAIFGAIGV